jgi:hypothetical protein
MKRSRERCLAGCRVCGTTVSGRFRAVQSEDCISALNSLLDGAPAARPESESICSACDLRWRNLMRAAQREPANGCHDVRGSKKILCSCSIEFLQLAVLGAAWIILYRFIPAIRADEVLVVLVFAWSRAARRGVRGRCRWHQ